MPDPADLGEPDVAVKASAKLSRELVRKVRLQRGIQSYWGGRAALLAAFVKSMNVVLSVFIAVLAFSDLGFLRGICPWLSQENEILLMGGAGLAIFLANALFNVFGLWDRPGMHTKAVELYSELLQDMRKARLESKGGDAVTAYLDQFNDRCMEIQTATVNVRGRAFNRAEAAYIRRELLRMARREIPFAFPWTVRRRATKLVDKWREAQSEL